MDTQEDTPFEVFELSEDEGDVLFDDEKSYLGWEVVPGCHCRLIDGYTWYAHDGCLEQPLGRAIASLTEVLSHSLCQSYTKSHIRLR